MIKDKITPEIKEKMKDAIKETIKTGNEYSFFICKDEKENLSATHVTKGTETEIVMGPPVKCPYKTQGNFHTHADLSNIKKFILKDIPVSEEVAREFALELARREGLPITTPSHPDVLSAFLNKCTNRTEGTVCVGSDADHDRVDCWTAKEVSKKKCMEVMLRFQTEFKHEPPKDWIKPLFDKEIIDLK